MGRADVKKYLPYVLGAVVIIVLAVIILLYQQSLQPEVIQSQAQLAEKNAALWQARAPFYEKLPSILVSGAYLALALLLGLGVGGLLLSLSVAVFGSVTSRVVHDGIGYYKSSPEGETKVYLAAPNTVVAAHLERISESGTADRALGPGGSAVSTGRVSVRPRPADTDDDAGDSDDVVTTSTGSRPRYGGRTTSERRATAFVLGDK